MLLYENEGFLEAEAKEISQLCRSTLAVTFVDADQGKYELQSILCDYQNKTEWRCRIAFYEKNLKRALVFAVSGTEKTPAWQNGQEALVQLGFQLEPVNLKLSPAMLEVVLRDVPGLVTPAEARNQRMETKRLMSGFQKDYDQAPASAKGKKAALKLNTEKRLSERAEKLRQFLELQFSPEEAVGDDMEALLVQVKDLTKRLATVEADADSERAQREMSESITAAAEKRIQELETLLVGSETKSSNTLKQKRRIVELQSRINELDAELAAAVADLENEREKQKQFVDDVNAANEQVVGLEHALKETEIAREETLNQLSEQGVESSELKENLREAELRVKVLGKELKRAEKKTSGCEEAVKSSEETHAHLVEVQQALNEAFDKNKHIEEDLASVVEEKKNLQLIVEQLEERQSEALGHEQRLVDQYTQLVDEHESLRQECDQEHSVRKRLEKGAIDDGKRLSELEKSLAETKLSAVQPLPQEASGSSVDEIVALERELQERLQCLELEQEARQELENELHDAHKMISSFEKMIQETEKVSEGSRSQSNPEASDSGKVKELEVRLQCLEAQLEAERIEQKRLVKELTAVEKNSFSQGGPSSAGESVEQSGETIPVAAKASKPLPHELRPAPKKGALFHPDWTIEGLPCRSADQVLKAWETVFNVQISLEGYPAQYCMAFLVLLRQGKQKRIYMLYRLKQAKHTLVCAPAKKPKDEASLQKTIKKGLDFLRKSGFEMDEMSSVNVEGTLGRYFLEAD